MANTPCPSDFRAGDELDPRSPYFEERLREGKAFVEFAWDLYFEPPHPTLGDSCPCVLSGYLHYSEQAPELSRKERSAMRQGVDFDPPEPTRAYESFEPLTASLPDGRVLGLPDLAREPGLGESLWKDEALEQLDAATQAAENPRQNKLALATLRSRFEPAPTPPKP